MPYEKKISRSEPGLVVLILDDSGSMSGNLAGTSDAKYAWVHRYAGIILKELLARSSEASADTVVVKPRYFLTVVLYGSTPQLFGAETMDIQAAVELYTRMGNSLGLGGKLGGTDAEAAFRMALEGLKRVVTQERFQRSFPPVLFHLTDGESATDASRIAEQIKSLATADGNVLVANAFIGTSTRLRYKGPEDFTGYIDAGEAGPSPDNVRLFQMSSPIPESMHQNLVNESVFPMLRAGARLFFDVRTKEMLKHVLQVVGSMGSRAERQVR